MPTHRIDAGISQEHFYAFLEEELKKIEKFTKHQVSTAVHICDLVTFLTVFGNEFRLRKSVALWPLWRAP